MIESVEKIGARDEPTKNVESQFSRNVNEISFKLRPVVSVDKRFELTMSQSSPKEVRYPLHVIFNLNGMLLAIKFTLRPPTRH